MSPMFRHDALYRHAGCHVLYGRKRGKAGSDDIKGHEMAGELCQIGRAEGGLKVSEEMPLGLFSGSGRILLKKEKKQKKWQKFKGALRQPQQRKWKNKKPTERRKKTRFLEAGTRLCRQCIGHR